MDEVAVSHDGGTLAGGFSFFCRFRAPLLSLGFFLFGSLLAVSEYSPRHGLGAEERERVGTNSRRSFFTRI